MSKIMVWMVNQKKVFHKLANRFIRIWWNISNQDLYETIKLSCKLNVEKEQLSNQMFSTPEDMIVFAYIWQLHSIYAIEFVHWQIEMTIQ